MKVETFAVPDNGDVDRGWAILPSCWGLVAVAFVSTVTRIWVRARLTRNLGWDDFFISLAMLTTIIGAGFITAEVLNGLGRHEYYLTPSQRRNFQAVGWADWVQIFITLCLTKVSICLFLLRIVDSRQVVRGMYVLIGFMVLFSSVFVFLFLGICRPLKAYWDVGVSGRCLSNPQVESIVIAQGVLSIVTDLVCAALPYIFLRNLQINRKTKIGLCILMSLGGITAICCTVRTSLSGAITDPDLTWAAIDNVGWRLPEVNIGIACANAPILRALYLFFHGRLSTQKSGSTGLCKERTWPSNAKAAWLEGSPQFRHESSDATMSMESGIPEHNDPDYEGPLKK